jgi:O-acetyl-ADP-ribose deacetylase (regulator of RNase III)
MLNLKNGLILEAMCGDLENFYADGIVVPNNTSLDWNSDLIRRLTNKAGKSTIDAAKERAPIPLGEALVTTGGGLLSSYIIHAALFPSGCTEIKNEIEKKDLLKLTIENCLLRCVEIEIESVGMPNLGDVLDLSLANGARLFLETISVFPTLKGNPLQKVCCLFEDEEKLRSFGKVMCGIFV